MKAVVLFQLLKALIFSFITLVCLSVAMVFRRKHKPYKAVSGVKFFNGFDD